MGAVSLVAWREWRDTLSSRWLVGFGFLFGLLTVGISYFGLSTARQVGFQGFSLVSASLLNLLLMTVPLLAMAQPALSLNAQGEGLSILLTQPVSRREILLGKYLGMVGALDATLLGGLLLGGGVVLFQAGAGYLGSFLLLMLLAAVLVGLFAAVGLSMAVIFPERSRALGAGLSVWFVLVILYDLLVFGLTVSGPGIPMKVLLLSALMLNPMDAARVLYLLATGSSSFVGVTGAVLAESLGSPFGMALLGGELLAWTLGMFALSLRLFERKDF